MGGDASSSLLSICFELWTPLWFPETHSGGANAAHFHQGAKQEQKAAFFCLENNRNSGTTLKGKGSFSHYSWGNILLSNGSPWVPQVFVTYVNSVKLWWDEVLVRALLCSTHLNKWGCGGGKSLEGGIPSALQPINLLLYHQSSLTQHPKPSEHSGRMPYFRIWHLWESGRVWYPTKSKYALPVNRKLGVLSRSRWC